MNLKQSSDRPIQIIAILPWSLSRNIKKLNKVIKTLNSKTKYIWILEAIKYIDFLLVLWLTDITENELCCFGSIYLRAVAAECDADLTRIIFPHTSLYLFWPISVSTNEATARAGAFLHAGARITSTGPFPRSFFSRLTQKWSGRQNLILLSATCSWVNIFIDPGITCY